MIPTNILLGRGAKINLGGQSSKLFFHDCIVHVIPTLYLGEGPKSAATSFESYFSMIVKMIPTLYHGRSIDKEYNKRLDCQRPCFEDELTGESNLLVQRNKSV